MDISLKQKQALEKRGIDISKHERRLIRAESDVYMDTFKKDDLDDDVLYEITLEGGLIKIYYVHETDKEFASRLIEEHDQRIRKQEHKKSQDARDLKLYQKLKKKFEGK